MNVKIKTSILLISTLLIGLIIGGFTGAYFSKKMLHERMSRLRTQEGFVSRFERTIQPQVDQKEIVRQLLSEYYLKIDSMSSEIRTNMKTHNDSLLTTMKEILNEEQLDRLKRRMKKIHRFTLKRKEKK